MSGIFRWAGSPARLIAKKNRPRGQDGFFHDTLAVGVVPLCSRSQCQISGRVEQPVQGLAPSQGGVGISGLVDLGEGIEEAPERSALEGLVGWMPPLVEHAGDLRGRDRLAIHRADHEVVGLWIVDASDLVGVHSLIELEELVSQLTHCPGREVAQVSHRMACVLATDPDFPGEREVVADEHPCSCNQTRRVGLIVAVSDSHDPRVVRTGL